MKKGVKISIISIAILLIASLIGLIVTGLTIGWGPFSFLHTFDREVNAIFEKYDATNRQNQIVFYGASNFALWSEMESDLSAYKVQNHGFGGSTDKDLVQYAPDILYPYNPDIVFFQTGSNDYVHLTGTDEEIVKICIDYKCDMFNQFHEKMPDAKFVVMSGLLLPGRSQYTELTQIVNKELAALCDEYDYMYFVDASEMTYDGSNFKSELFEKDGIHLNRDGQKLWCNEYIQPTIDQLIEEWDLSHLKK